MKGYGYVLFILLGCVFSMIIIIMMVEKKENQMVEIDRLKNISAVLDNAVIFEKGKRYRMKGGKDVEFHVDENDKVSLEFTADSIIITRIGCVANIKFYDKFQNANEKENKGETNEPRI